MFYIYDLLNLFLIKYTNYNALTDNEILSKYTKKRSFWLQLHDVHIYNVKTDNAHQYIICRRLSLPQVILQLDHNILSHQRFEERVKQLQTKRKQLCLILSMRMDYIIKNYS